MVSYAKVPHPPWRVRRWRLIPGAFLFVLAAAPVAAQTPFTGTLPTDNQVELFTLTLNSSESITIQTYSYAGGTVNSTVFSAGGFAPTAFLFDGQGNVLTLTNGTSSQVGQDPTTGNSDDLYFQDTLGPGTYTLALAVYNNRPVDTAVADGFVQNVNPGFTCQETLVIGGNFCDATTALGTPRTGA